MQEDSQSRGALHMEQWPQQSKWVAPKDDPTPHIAIQATVTCSASEQGAICWCGSKSVWRVVVTWSRFIQSSSSSSKLWWSLTRNTWVREASFQDQRNPHPVWPYLACSWFLSWIQKVWRSWFPHLLQQILWISPSWRSGFIFIINNDVGFKVSRTNNNNNNGFPAIFIQKLLMSNNKEKVKYIRYIYIWWLATVT